MIARFGVIALLLSLASGLPADDKKDDKDKLQGEWVMARSEAAGKKSGPNNIKGVKLVVRMSEWVPVSPDGKESKYTFELDATKEPKTVDVTMDDGRKALGIYKLDGDMLTVCLTPGRGARPSEFKTTQSNRYRLIEYKRGEKK